MRYFIDTEYEFTASPQSAVILPISIALVAEDGRESYHVNSTALRQGVIRSPFVLAHVLPVIDDPYPFSTCPTAGIADDLRFFVGSDTPEFWGDYADFDYVVLSTIMGGFDAWPDGWPMHINDFQQEAIPTLQSAVPHNALADARALRESWNWAFQSAARQARAQASEGERAHG